MIDILSTGPLCSVQDLGRRGHRQIGVSVSGAMDVLSLRAANAMAGNAQDAAGIEVTVFPFRARFHARTVVAVCGAGCRVSIGERAMPLWWCVQVEAGDVLTLKPSGAGARAYVAVSGGIDVPAVLGSRSTDIKVGFGGFEGRCLRKGDTLSIGNIEAGSGGAARIAKPRGYGVRSPDIELAWHDGVTWHTPAADASRKVTHVRVLRGPDYDAFRDDALVDFWRSAWKVTPDSNRIGYRLAGPEIRLREPLDLLSHGIVPGVIQIPPSGQPIVMMSDAQTSGGYPIVGTVIEADRWRLAQSPIGSEVVFHEVDVDQAVAASQVVTGWIDRIARSRWSVS